LQETSPGYYGKLPRFGDFLTRRLPRQFTEPWDNWLQNVMSCSNEQLGDGWLDSYLTSPIWRFALTANVLSEAAWAGVLMPSVDRVGRYFPFTIAAPFAATLAPLRLAEAAKTWFERLDEIALSALDDEFDLETLDKQLEELGGPIRHETAPISGGLPTANRRLAMRCDLGPAVDVSVVLPELTTRVLHLVAPAHGIWWNWGSDEIRSSVLLTEGLPPVTGFAAMLDGDWKRWGWDDEANLSTSPIDSELGRGD
jgi:type VI secretion system protein ImpM